MNKRPWLRPCSTVAEAYKMMPGVGALPVVDTDGRLARRRTPATCPCTFFPV